jgi:hypothetical protein
MTSDGLQMPVTVACGSLAPMSAPDMEFRWTMGVSALTHVIVLGAIWFSAAAHAVEPANRRFEPDVWIGTTVSVVEAPRESVVPEQPESSPSLGRAALAAGAPSKPKLKPAEPGSAPEARKLRVHAPIRKDADVTTASPAGHVGLDASKVRRPAAPDTSAGAAGIDLKQAMQNSIAQPASESLVQQALT